MRLFGYIQGDNEADAKIAMTTPVFMTEGEGLGASTMSFVLPEQIATNGAPEATVDNVQIGSLPAGRYAVYRFSGRRTEDRISSMKTDLVSWMRKQGLEPAGDFLTAGYDPPFTPPGLQRNEVLIRVEAE